MQEPRPVIGVPHLGDLREYFVKSLLGLDKPANCFVVFVQDAPVDLARNSIVEAFLSEPSATHLFFMDSDQVFHPQTLRRMMGVALEHGIDVLTGLVIHRGEVPMPNLYRFHHIDPVTHLQWYQPMGEELAAWVKAHPSVRGNVALEEPWLRVCDSAGAGCLLISRKVLEEMHAAHADSYYPWFEIAPGTRGGEDFEFYRRAQGLGYRIWADLSVQVNHESRGGFVGREEFVECFAVGTPEEHDWDQPLLIDLGPAGRTLKTRPRQNLQEELRKVLAEEVPA